VPLLLKMTCTPLVSTLTLTVPLGLTVESAPTTLDTCYSTANCLATSAIPPLLHLQHLPVSIPTQSAPLGPVMAGAPETPLT
jgi:hypothetical protein